MPRNNALRFKSGKGKSIRIDKLHAQRTSDVLSKFDRLRSTILVVCVFLFSILFLSSFFIYKNLNQHFASADSYSTYVPEYPTFSYLVVNSLYEQPISLKKLKFVVLDKTSNKVIVFELPLNIDLDLNGKYYGASLEKLFLLGGVTSENKLEGGLYLINSTLLKIFGFDVSNFIVVEEPIDATFSELLVDGKEIFPFAGLSPSVMADSFYTDYSLKDFYQMQKFLANTPRDNIIFKVLSPEDLHSNVSIDSLLSNMSMSSIISKEKKTISVLNGTTMSGVATLGSRVISNMGGRVVAIENATTSYDNTILISDDPDSPTIAYIKESFDIDKVYTKEEASFIKEDAISRSDIVLIMGFDLATRLY